MDSSEQKVNTPKAKLPTKTRIAVWWMITVGLVLIIGLSGLLLFALIYSFGSEMDGGSAVPNLVLYFFLPFCGVFTLISGILLGKESKQAWKVTAIILAITIICFLGLSLYSLINAVVYIIPLISLLEGLSCFIPLILIILDRKNYFEMVRQRELEENGNG